MGGRLGLNLKGQGAALHSCSHYVGKAVEVIRFLLVEDDTSAALIAQSALEDGWKKWGISGEVVVCRDGSEAIAYLNSTDKDKLPHVILSDLKMPRLGGLELLKILKLDSRFLRIPVVIVSTSTSLSDINAAWEQQCAGYVFKAASYEEFANSLDKLQQYWANQRLGRG